MRLSTIQLASALVITTPHDILFHASSLNLSISTLSYNRIGKPNLVMAVCRWCPAVLFLRSSLHTGGSINLSRFFL